MGILETGVNSAVRFTFRHGRWVVPIALTGCMIGSAFLNWLPADTFVSNPTPIPTPGLTGVGGGGELPRTATSTPSKNRKCVSIGDLPPGKHTSYSALRELAKQTGRQWATETDIVYWVHGKGDEEQRPWQEALREDDVYNADSWCIGDK